MPIATVAASASAVGRKVQGWSISSANGNRIGPPYSSDPAATTIGSYSVSRRPKIVAQANEMVASRMTISAKIWVSSVESASSNAWTMRS